VRPQIGLAYLFCRAADTIADTSLIPEGERLKYLELFREQFQCPSVSWKTVKEIQTSLRDFQKNTAEETLLTHLDDCFQTFLTFSSEDQDRIRSLVSTLTKGMEMDLIRFPLQNARDPFPLSIEDEMDQYTYYVAGVVGEFWTRMSVGHFQALRNWKEDEMCKLGIRFGKGLQMTNILKDLSKDLSKGRCYIPKTLLDRFELKPHDLLEPSTIHQLRPLLASLIRLTLDHLEKGWDYIMAIPKGEIRLRLACLWPHLFALKTIGEIYHSDKLLDPNTTVKISHASVYSTMFKSTLLVSSNKGLTRYYDRLRENIVKALP
jgi:farnesyl-diphosphate farnesyltransferase